MPTLTVLALSDSFSSLWPALATECGLGLSMADDPSALDQASGTVALVSGAGAEDGLVDAVRRAAGGAVEIGAIGSIESHRLAAEAVRAGAADYFALPGDHDLLRSWLRERAEALRSRLRRSEFAAGEGRKYRFDGILGDSPALQVALDRAARVIPHPSVTVLLTGETGTGKELLARAIHYNGPRREAPFVDLNCAAIPANLLESEMFGHEKGAFTDARAAKPGLFELASGGTLFLDEIGELRLDLQSKLLRAIQEGEIERIGGSKPIRTDFRLVVATNVDLERAVNEGRFREDLYYRINVIPIRMPPLRERLEDLPELARFFVRRCNQRFRKRISGISGGAISVLKGYWWKGNVRELENLIERVAAVTDKDWITEEDLPLDFHMAKFEAAEEEADMYQRALDTFERNFILRALQKWDWNVSATARHLGLPLSTLKHKMHRLDIVELTRRLRDA